MQSVCLSHTTLHAVPIVFAHRRMPTEFRAPQPYWFSRFPSLIALRQSGHVLQLQFVQIAEFFCTIITIVNSLNRINMYLFYVFIYCVGLHVDNSTDSKRDPEN